MLSWSKGRLFEAARRTDLNESLDGNTFTWREGRELGWIH